MESWQFAFIPVLPLLQTSSREYERVHILINQYVPFNSGKLKIAGSSFVSSAKYGTNLIEVCSELSKLE